jgi:hypothetical protein
MAKMAVCPLPLRRLVSETHVPAAHENTRARNTLTDLLVGPPILAAAALSWRLDLDENQWLQLIFDAAVKSRFCLMTRPGHSINCPPLTSIVSPATYAAAFEARNAITVAHSSEVPVRPIGIPVTKFLIISGVENTS